MKIAKLIALNALLDQVLPKLQTLIAAEGVIGRIATNLEKIMATAQEFKATLAEIDAETTRIANAIQVLVDRITAGGMSGPEEAEVKAELTAHLDRLKGIASDPEQPIPPE